MRLKPWLFFLIVALVITALAFVAHVRRYRFVRSNADLVRLLPRTGGSLFFVDVGVLRRAGLHQLFFARSSAAEFTKETHLDFASDVDVLAGTLDGAAIFAALRGRFDWEALRRYALAHGGRCDRQFCATPATRPGQWISFVPVQPDVMAVAASSDASAARSLLQGRAARPVPMPPQPVWATIPASLLRNPVRLPLAVRIFAISIQSADRVLLSLSADDRGPGFKLQLDADFPNATAADTARKQLEIDTTLFTHELAREHEQPNPADLSGLLVRGSFEARGKHLTGVWPVSMQLLKALE